MDEPTRQDIELYTDLLGLMGRIRRHEAEFEANQTSTSLHALIEGYTGALSHDLLGQLSSEERFALYWSWAYYLFARYTREGTRADLEPAKSGFLEALDLSEPEDEDLGVTYMHLGSVYRELGVVHGAPTHLETSLDYYDRALLILDDQYVREAKMQRAVCLWRIAQMTGDQASNREALRDLAAMMKLAQTRLQPVVPIAINLIAALKTEYEVFGEPQALDLAITHCLAIGDLIPEGSLPYGAFQTNLSSALGSRFERSGDPRDLDQAIIAAERAVNATPEGNMHRASCLNNHGALLMARWQSGADGHDLANALLAHHAAATSSAQIKSAALHWNNFSTASFQAFCHMKDPILLSNAVQAGDHACKLVDADDPLAPVYQSNYATALTEKYRWEREPEDIERAIYFADRSSQADLALERQSRWATLASAYFARGVTTSDARDIDLAIDAQLNAIKQCGPLSKDRPLLLGNLADMRLARNAIDDRECADGLYQDAIQQLKTQIALGERSLKQVRLIQRYFARRAELAFEKEDFDTLLELAIASKGIWMQSAQRLAKRAQETTSPNAFALRQWQRIKQEETLWRMRVHAGRAGPNGAEALAELSQRAAALEPQVQLALATDTKTEDPVNLESLLPSDRHGLVACIETQGAGLITVLAANQSSGISLSAEAIPELTKDKLRDISAVDPLVWHGRSQRPQLSALVTWIARHAEKRQVRNLVCLFSESLARAPIETVPTETGISLSDQLIITRLPGLSGAKNSIPSPSVLREADWCILSDSIGDLPFAQFEAQSLSSWRDKPFQIGLGNAANMERLIADAEGASLVHLAVHAIASEPSFLDSEIFLAQPAGAAAPLRVDDILRGKLGFAPGALVVLSACESGQQDQIRGSEEHFGFASAFLAAGAGGVVSTLWQVSDLAAAYFFDAFYAFLFQDHLHPAEATDQARKALKRATKADVLGFLERAQAYTETRQDAGRRRALRTLRATRLWLEKQPQCPFENSIYWAAFYYSGFID